MNPHSLPVRPVLHATAAVAALLLLGGCTTLGNVFGDKNDYRTKAAKTQPLEVPPDLSQLARDGRYRAPTGGAVTASGTAAAAAAAGPGATVAGVPPTAPDRIGDIRVERQGNQRWLVVPATPEQLWPRLREFWQERGFTLAADDPTTGVMETNWAENRAKIPQDFIRGTIGRLFDFAYSSSERDRFRTRVERTPAGTEVTISHRGMEEIYTSAQRDNTAWRPRANDPQLEAEMLTRLMVRLGAPEARATAAVASAPEVAPRARPVTPPAAGAAPAAAAARSATSLEIEDNFDRAWRRVGLALDRSSFTIEDRDRAAGLYFVRWVDPKTLPKEQGSFLGWIFGEKGGTPVRVRVLVKAVEGQANRSIVSVQNAQGAAETGDVARSIVEALARELR